MGQLPSALPNNDFTNEQAPQIFTDWLTDWLENLSLRRNSWMLKAFIAGNRIKNLIDSNHDKSISVS